jgi:enoyl-CoA hydratase
MLFQNLLIENKGPVQYIIINRETKMNALNKATINELHEALAAAFGNHDVGGVILTGAGQKAFVAGADISEFAGADIVGGREVAAINGFALGGGLELAMACHIRVAAETAKMGLPEVTLGLIPGYGGTQRLTQLVGKGKALEMIMTADMITAAEAHSWGLVNHVVPQENLLAKAEEILGKIILRAPLAIASAIAAVNAANKNGVNGFETEIREFANCFGTDDFKEGVCAFLEKRKPNFKGK